MRLSVGRWRVIQRGLLCTPSRVLCYAAHTERRPFRRARAITLRPTSVALGMLSVPIISPRCSAAGTLPIQTMRNDKAPVPPWSLSYYTRRWRACWILCVERRHRLLVAVSREHGLAVAEWEAFWLIKRESTRCGCIEALPVPQIVRTKLQSCRHLCSQQHPGDGESTVRRSRAARAAPVCGNKGFQGSRAHTLGVRRPCWLRHLPFHSHSASTARSTHRRAESVVTTAATTLRVRRCEILPDERSGSQSLDSACLPRLTGPSPDDRFRIL